MPSVDPRPYDAVLLVSFGGPERPEDVVPFLENVTRGRGISRERLEQVGEHYFHFGGRSPINDQNRDVLEALRADFAASGLDLPVYWGNRNWDPLLADTLTQMRDDGVTRAACFLTSAYSSYSGCRQYRENLAEATAAVEGAPRLDRLRAYFHHPGFVDACADATLAALDELPGEVRAQARLLFVTHSIPVSMSDSSGPHGNAYVDQHRSVMAQIVERVAATTGHPPTHDLVYCSRSGSPSTPWLEPDVNDHLEALAIDDVRAVVLVPIGFVSDHMEVVWDLDTEALGTAERLGIAAVRAGTAGLDPRFVAMVRDLVLERAVAERGGAPVRARVGDLAPLPDLCVAGCCPNPRAALPALGESAPGESAPGESAPGESVRGEPAP